MKKFIAITLSVLICLSLFGCKADNNDNDPENTSINYESITNSEGKVAVGITDENNELVTDEKGDYVTEMAVAVTNENNELVTNELGQLIVEKENGEQMAVGEPTATTAPTSNNASKPDDAKDKTSSTSKNVTSTSAKNNTSAAKKPAVANTTTKPTTTKKQETTKKPATTKTTAAPTVKDSITVNVTINGTDGQILSSYPVNVKKGTPVSEILKLACDENKIDVVVKTSPLGGTTVNKIGNIEGKWFFTVNGENKTYNFREQNLKNNDNIVVSL